MVFNSVLNNFTSGEWSPKMLARTDTEQYARACKEITNGYVRPQGGIFRRPGTIRQDSFSFVLPHDERKVIIPYTARGNKFAIFATNNNWYAVQVAFWVNFSVVLDAGVTLPAAPELLRYVQVGDTLFIVHPLSPPLVLKQDPNTPLTLRVSKYQEYYTTANGQENAPWRSMPFGAPFADGIGGTITVTGTLTAGGNVTLVATNDIFPYSPFPGPSFGNLMYIKITSAGNTAVIKITGTTSTKNATGVMMSAKAGTSPLVVGAATGTGYELSSWGEFSPTDGTIWPSTITAIQNRLVFGKGPTLYFTRAGNYYDLMEIPFQQASTYTAYPSDGSRPFNASPFSTDLVRIRELTSAKTLIVLTDTSEIVGYGGANGISALPGGFIVESSSSFGSQNVAPVRVNNYVTFAQATGDTIRDLSFNWESSQYKASDLSFPAEHFFRSAHIYTMTATEALGSHLWVLNKDGTLVHCSLDRDYNITAWTRISINGYEVQAIATIKGDQVYIPQDFLLMLVKDLATNQVSIVGMSVPYEFAEIPGPSGELPVYMDLTTLVNHVTPTNTITGLSFYNGKEVQIIADGFYMGKFVISGGSVTIPRVHSKALVGIPSTFRIETMPIEAGARLGDATGKDKKVDEVFIRFFNTIGAKYGCPQTNEYYDIPFRQDTEPMNEPTTPKTMDISLKFPHGYSKIATVVVESDYPFPCNVLGIGIQGVTNE